MVVMQRVAGDALSATLFAVSDPTRRGLLAQLALGDATVKDLARPYDMSVAAISKHLHVLESAGLVRRKQEAQYTRCSLRPEPLRAVSAWLDDYRRFWERSLDALDAHLATMERTKKKRKER
jgi:DNA-binding transcriptional ArsR family regulator